MESTSVVAERALKRTRTAFMWNNVLHTPFWAIFSLLPFILYKDLHASVIQVTAIIVLKPAVSLFSLYWCSLIEKRKDRLLDNLIWAKCLSHVPFFFFPFIDSPWFFIASFGIYMAFYRGIVPAWMEILKLNIPGVSRERVFAYGSSFSYFGMALLPFVLGGLLDSYHQAWRWLFPVTALISLCATYFLIRIPISYEKLITSAAPFSWREQLLKPWKTAWALVGKRRDFLHYQIGFMLGGSGLIIMQPALPVFFMDNLHLSYTELAVALTLCKGVGFVLTSPSWAQIMNRIDIYRFNGWVTLFAFAFPFCLIAAQVQVAWLYAGYLLYGIMQAGSEMSWHLSGPLFAKEEDSSSYTSINVLTVGLRGCFVPAVGSLLCCTASSQAVMLIGGALCLLATERMFAYSRHYAVRPFSLTDPDTAS